MYRHFDKIKERYEELTQLLIKYDDHYYNKTALIGDDEFDKLYMESLEIESQYPILVNDQSRSVRVGSKSRGNLHRHLHRLYSLNKSLLPSLYQKDLNSFIGSFKKICNQITLVFQPKLDGCAVSISFRNGQLDKVLTRGDGVEGSDITQLYLAMGDITSLGHGSKYTDTEIQINGEMVIKRSAFENLNEDRIRNDTFPYKNPRAAVSGILNAREVEYAKYITFAPYDVIGDPYLGDSYACNMNELSHIGFHEISMALLPISLDIPMNDLLFQVSEISNEIFESNKDFPCDGIVIKIDSRRIQDIKGYNHNSPNWALALKKEEFIATSIITDVISSMSRFGRLSPVIIIKPVILNGVTVTRVSGSNFGNVEKMGIKIGMKCKVCLLGDVRPTITEVYDTNPDGEIVHTPIRCPSCGTDTEVLSDGSLVCTGINCPEKLEEQIRFIVSKKCLNLSQSHANKLKKLIAEDNIQNLDEFFYSLKWPIFSGSDCDPTLKIVTKAIQNISFETMMTIPCLKLLTPRMIKIIEKHKILFFEDPDNIDMLRDKFTSKEFLNLRFLLNHPSSKARLLFINKIRHSDITS